VISAMNPAIAPVFCIWMLEGLIAKASGKQINELVNNLRQL